MAPSGQHKQSRCPRTSGQTGCARAWGLHEGQVYDRVVLPLPGLGNISEDVPKAEESNL